MARAYPSQFGRLRREWGPVYSAFLPYIVLIFVGAVFLSTPFVTQSGRPLPFIDALFTSTSALCVTGLVVVDTGSTFNWAGEAFIALLIQVGGLGYMTLSAALILLVRRSLDLRTREGVRETLGAFTMADVIPILKRAVAFTAAVEFAGFLLFLPSFSARVPFWQAVKFSLFHSISAFCNAGFDLFGEKFEPFCSMRPLSHDPWICAVTMVLVISGGLGFIVVSDLWTKRRWRRLSFHSKVVLSSTAALLLLSWGLFLLFEWENPSTLGRMGVGGKLLNALFQAVTPRTAGFSTIPTGMLTPPSLLLCLLLMFVGASPGGTGGGIKTTTSVVLLLSFWASIRGEEEPGLYGRSIGALTVRRAMAVAFFGLLVVLGCLLVLSLSLPQPCHEKFPFLAMLFEATSAFGTVGLSMGATSHLTFPAKVAIIVTMLLGRLGPATLATVVALRQRPPRVRYPSEPVAIG